jgi:hypothetical protein
MTQLTIDLGLIVSILAIIVAACFAWMQLSVYRRQADILEEQAKISSRQAIYQGQQATISQQQARLLSRQLELIREQEDNRKKKEELFLLIAPLYTSFKKDPDIIDWMSLRETGKIWLHDDNPSKKERLINLEAEIIEIMRQRKGLAQEPLYSKIEAFDNLLPNYRKNSWEMAPFLKEIFELVKTRYNELIGQ